MNKTTQDLAWQSLPFDAKNEVRQAFATDTENDYERGYDNALVSLFGLHNLTSDADGEDEMLTCNKESVCKFYAHLLDMVENERMSEHYPEWCDLESEYIALYGEKAFADYFRADTKQAPAKTKFEVGDIVRIKSDAAEYHQGYINGYAWLPERDIFVGKITTITNIRISGDIELKISGGNITWEAIDLEYYTEPKKESRNLSQETANCDKQFDNILKDSIREHNRLHIATQLLTGLLASGKEKHLVSRAISLTDALIAECKKMNYDNGKK